MRRLSLSVARLFVLVLAVALGCNSSETPTGPGGGNNGGGDDTTIVTPDTIAPSRVTDPALAFDQASDIATLSWSAPFDDAPDQPVTRYDIRYTTTLGATPPAFWIFSIPVANPPVPMAPGTRQEATVSGLTPFRDLWMGIRSFDAEGNVSPGSDLVKVRVPGLSFSGRCVDVYTDGPLEGLSIRLTAPAVSNAITDLNGEFRIDDLPEGLMNIEITDNPALPDYHRLSQIFIAARDTAHTFEMIPVQPTISPNLGGITLLAFLKQVTFLNLSPILARWKRVPVPCYIPPFVSPDTLDYQAVSAAAAQRWMDRTQQQIFTFVPQAPDTGIVVSYRAPGVGTAATFTTLGQDGHPILSEIKVDNDVSDPNFLFRVMMHEFGHTIRLDHILFPEFIMFPGPILPDDITDDEANVVILHQALPVRVNMTIYDESATTAQVTNHHR